MTNPTVRLRVDLVTLCSVGAGKIALLEAIHRAMPEARAVRAFKGIAEKARGGTRSASTVPVVRLGGRPGVPRLEVRLRSRQRYHDEQEVT